MREREVYIYIYIYIYVGVVSIGFINRGLEYQWYY